VHLFVLLFAAALLKPLFKNRQTDEGDPTVAIMQLFVLSTVKPALLDRPAACAILDSLVNDSNLMLPK
jgi:hypothetical protein